MSTQLSGKDRRALRALGHHLKPLLQIGHAGVTAALVDATTEAFSAHELIKVRVLDNAPIDRAAAAEELAHETGAELAQVLGRTFLIYRRHPKAPRIALPGRPLPPPEPAPAAKASARVPGKPVAAKKTARSGPRRGTGARLPPRRHGR